MNETGLLYSVSAELENSVFFKDMKAPLKSIITENTTNSLKQTSGMVSSKK